MISIKRQKKGLGKTLLLFFVSSPFTKGDMIKDSFFSSVLEVIYTFGDTIEEF